MEVDELIKLLFGGGGGIIGVATFLLARKTFKTNKTNEYIDRLSQEIRRQDSLLSEMRNNLSERDTELMTTREQLMSEQRKNHELELLVIEMKATIERLEDTLERMKGGKLE